jgi:hypothetical protein
VAATLKEKLDAFKVYLPLIQALRTPGMRERHWAKLSQEVQVCVFSLYLDARILPEFVISIHRTTSSRTCL